MHNTNTRISSRSRSVTIPDYQTDLLPEQKTEYIPAITDYPLDPVHDWNPYRENNILRIAGAPSFWTVHSTSARYLR